MRSVSKSRRTCSDDFVALGKVTVWALMYALAGFMTTAQAQPAFNASSVGELTVLIPRDTSNPFSVENSASFYPTGSGAPETAFTSGARNGGVISSRITQTAPYILNGQYWAGTWNITIDATENAGGQFGFGVAAASHSSWFFGIDGLSTSEAAHTTFYFAATWEMTPYEDLTPEFVVNGPTGGYRTLFHEAAGFGDASGSYSGSFRPVDYVGTNMVPFNVYAGAGGYFRVNPHNAASSVDFTYSIAFSTTPIDASVFTTPVPEPETYAMLLAGLGLLGFAARRRKQKDAALA